MVTYTLELKVITPNVKPHLYPHFEPNFVLVLNDMVLVLVLVLD